jgi:hypothetical protein
VLAERVVAPEGERFVMRRSSFHEDLDRGEAVTGSSDRSFGLLLAGACAVVGGVRVWRANPSGWWWFLVAGVFLVLAVIRPSALRPVNRLWLRLSLLLYRTVNPVVLGLIFYACVTPIGLVMRMLGKHALPLKFDPNAQSYWIERRPPGPTPETMRRQF